MTEYCEHSERSERCEHKTTVYEDSMIFCVSFGEEIHRIISTGKDELARFPSYSERYIYRFKYDRTERFIKLLDECTVDITSVCMETIQDFEIISKTHAKSKRKSFINLNFVLYQLCNKNGIDVDKSKIKLPKSKKSRVRHENICQVIFKKLGWNYISIL